MSGAPDRDIGVVLVAAGAGRRFGEKKQFLELAGRPLILHSIDVFSASESVGELAVVVPGEDVARVRGLIGGSLGETSLRISVVVGGARRQDSVLAGLRSLSAGARWAMVHDAARPLVRRDDIDRFIEALRAHGAAVLGYPSSDSVKEERDGAAERNLPRERVWLVQTPQGAGTARLIEALEVAEREGVAATDEASVLELLGDRVALVEGTRENIKVTFPDDFELAEFLLARRRS